MSEIDLIGEYLDGYSITTQLTSRSSSSLFLGESLSLTADYARVVARLLDVTDTCTPQELQSILEEISSLQQLHHPHILPILSVGLYKNIPYFITEYIASGSLYDHLQNRPPGQPMQQKEALSLLTQIGQALHYAHQHGVIHGGLKPQNVLFMTPDFVLLTDFHIQGLSFPDRSETTHSSDEPIYLAPEQLAGHMSPKSDQYALGCLAYEMLTGSRAFMIPSANTPGLYYRTKSLIVPGRLNPDLPSYREKAILKAISRDPAQRYSNIPAFLAALEVTSAIEEMKQDEMATEPALPIMPLPAIDELTTVIKKEQIRKQSLAAETSLPTSDNTTLVPIDIPRLAEPQEHSSSAVPVFSTRNRNSSSHIISKKPVLTRQQRFAVILCLITIAVILGALLLPFKSSTPVKGLTATSSANTTTIVSPSISASWSATIVRASSSSSSGRTLPVQVTATAQNMVNNLTPTSVFTPLPTATSSSRSAPSPTSPPARPAPSPTSPPARPAPSPTSPPARSAPSPTSPPARPAPTPTSPPAPATTLVRVPLASFFNNVGIGYMPGQANFDGSGYSYPANQLPSGTVTVNGVPYQFPVSWPGLQDNIIATGQTISFTPGSYRWAYFLASASWGPVTGTVTVQYTDGSSSSTRLTVPDWLAGQGSGLQTSYRYGPNRMVYRNATYIYAIPVALDSTRIANALVLPGQLYGRFYQNSRLHVFALTVVP